MPVLAAPDFTHVCEAGFTIEGHVTTADNRPVERVGIEAYPMETIGAFTAGYSTGPYRRGRTIPVDGTAPRSANRHRISAGRDKRPAVVPI